MKNFVIYTGRTLFSRKTNSLRCRGYAANTGEAKNGYRSSVKSCWKMSTAFRNFKMRGRYNLQQHCVRTDVHYATLLTEKLSHSGRTHRKVQVLKPNSVIYIRLFPDCIEYPNNTAVSCPGRPLDTNAKRHLTLPIANVRTIRASKQSHASSSRGPAHDRYKFPAYLGSELTML